MRMAPLCVTDEFNQVWPLLTYAIIVLSERVSKEEADIRKLASVVIGSVRLRR